MDETLADLHFPLVSKEAVLKRLTNIPRTRYYGSKRRFLPWILDAVYPLSFESVMEPFGGAASVSQLFQAMGKRVHFHDGLYSNYVVAKVLLNQQFSGCSKEMQIHLSSIRPTTGFITKEFKGKFFTSQENRWLDGAMKYIATMANDSHRNLLLYSLFQACLKKRPFNLFHRANLGLRLKKNVKRSFGNATTWEKSFVAHITTAFEELQAMGGSDVFDAKLYKPKGSYLVVICSAGNLAKYGMNWPH